jgi:hypothetical protein
MGKKPLLTLAGLFLAGVAISATGCGQCTQCSTRPGKFHSNGPQAKAPTPAVGDSKRSEVARETGKKPQPAPNGDILPVGGNSFEKMPSTTPMKSVPNTYSGDPPMGSIPGVGGTTMPGREVGEGSTYSPRESVAVPALPATPRTKPEGYEAVPKPPVNQPGGPNPQPPGVGTPGSDTPPPLGYQTQPIAPPNVPPIPTAPKPPDLGPRPAPPPPRLPEGIESSPVAAPSGVPSGLPGDMPSGMPGGSSTTSSMTPPLSAPPASTLPGSMPPSSTETQGPKPAPLPTGSLPGLTPAVPEIPRPAPTSPSGVVPGANPPNLPGEDLPPLK